MFDDASASAPSDTASAAEGAAILEGDLDDVVRCAQLQAGGELVVVILCGLCGAGKSATANTLGRTTTRAARRSAASVTRKCGVTTSAADGLVALDTPGLGDVSFDAMQIQRALDAVDAAVSLRAPETALRFATVYVASVATRLGDEDIRAMRTLRDCLGSAWRQNAIMLWTHADLLERNTLQDHLEGLDEEIRRATIDSLGGGSLVVDNARGGDAGDQTHRDLLIAAVRRLAGPRPHPRGKHARRLRQHATRQRERDNDPADGGRWCAVM